MWRRIDSWITTHKQKFSQLFRFWEPRVRKPLHKRERFSVAVFFSTLHSERSRSSVPSRHDLSFLRRYASYSLRDSRWRRHCRWQSSFQLWRIRKMLSKIISRFRLLYRKTCWVAIARVSEHMVRFWGIICSCVDRRYALKFFLIPRSCFP